MSSRWIDLRDVAVDRHPMMPEPLGPVEARYIALFVAGGANRARRPDRQCRLLRRVLAPPQESAAGAERHRVERRVVDRAEWIQRSAPSRPRRCQCPWSARAVRRRRACLNSGRRGVSQWAASEVEIEMVTAPPPRLAAAATAASSLKTPRSPCGQGRPPWSARHHHASE